MFYCVIISSLKKRIIRYIKKKVFALRFRKTKHFFLNKMLKTAFKLYEINNSKYATFVFLP